MLNTSLISFSHTSAVRCPKDSSGYTNNDLINWLFDVYELKNVAIVPVISIRCWFNSNVKCYWPPGDREQIWNKSFTAGRSERETLAAGEIIGLTSCVSINRIVIKVYQGPGLSWDSSTVAFLKAQMSMILY